MTDEGQPGGLEGEHRLDSDLSIGRVSFEHLDDVAFEDVCRDLLAESGFVNIDWRKGTPRNASPSDRGRDLVGQIERTDVDGHRYAETWFVDCKHHKRGVPPTALQGLFSWAEAEQPDVALVIASGFLSNAAKDWIARYQATRRPPFRIRYWEKAMLARLIKANSVLAQRHSLIVRDSAFSQAEPGALELRTQVDVLSVRLELAERALQDKDVALAAVKGDLETARRDRTRTSRALALQIEAFQALVGAEEVATGDTRHVT